MSKTLTASAAVAIAAAAGTANAQLVDGSAFTAALGVGTAGGFGALLGSGDVTINGAGASYATPITGTIVDISATMVDGPTQDDVTIVFEVNQLLSPGGQLFPLLSLGGTPQDVAFQFAGSNAGPTPILTVPGATFASLEYEFFDALGTSTALIPFGVAGAPFTGGFGVSLGDNVGFGDTRLEVRFSVVPAPASAGLLAIGGLVAARRRRS